MAEEFLSFNEARLRFEKRYAEKLLQHTKGSVVKAAKISKKERKDFYNLLCRNNIDPKKFRKRKRKNHKKKA